MADPDSTGRVIRALMSVLARGGAARWLAATVCVAVVCGCILSIAREVRLGRKPRLQGEDTFITRQVTFLVYGLVGAGVVLSATAPATGFVAGPNVPIIWGADLLDHGLRHGSRISQ